MRENSILEERRKRIYREGIKSSQRNRKRAGKPEKSGEERMSKRTLLMEIITCRIRHQTLGVLFKNVT